ncbi:MAG: flagellar basal body P-ring protein FlgI [Planctomycetota bacterium]
MCLWGAASAHAGGEVRVQDIARLQGQRTNKLMGYGLVVGLPGTGDGDKYLPTLRALAGLHQRYHAPIFADVDVKGNRSVALAAVEAVIPEHGAREGQALDVAVSAVGTAKSLAGGQLLTTPLQYAMFDPNDPATQQILALAGGPVVTATETPTRGTVRGGAVLEADFIYSFIADDAITLVLDEGHADWTWAHVVARALNHELVHPAARGGPKGLGTTEVAPDTGLAQATGPKTVVVRIPAPELASPARFIATVQQTPLFDLPEQPARVTINRSTKEITFTHSVKVSPTVLQVPGVGTIRIGRPGPGPTSRPAGGAPSGGPSPAPPVPGLSANALPTASPGAEPLLPIGFDELYDTLATIKIDPDRLIEAVEQLHASGALHAQLQYQ